MQEGFVDRLAWDPSEWEWQGSMGVPPSSFVQYSACLGYKIGLSCREHSACATVYLKNLGFQGSGRLRVWNRVWDAGKARKVSLFLWLMLTQGISTNKWRSVMGTSTECQVCH